MAFVGRHKELRTLREENWRSEALLVALYGRRRVGKTALIEEAYNDEVVWKFEGIENGSASLHITYFLEQLSQYTAIDTLSASTWKDCFQHLLDGIGSHLRSHPKQRLVVFFDEFQWMCSMRSSLVSEFKYFWDNGLKKHPELVFVICGSISSFIVKKVVQSKALYGRIDLEIDLKPLPLTDIPAFFPNHRSHIEILETQMILGGIPQYLKQLNPKRSFIQNLNELAFKPGYFFKEFDRLFLSHFSTNPHYKTILMRLAKAPSTYRELSAAVKIKSGGTLTKLLEELELAGFIERIAPLGKSRSSKLLKFRLLDEYLHFYFTFIQPNSRAILSGAYQYQQATLSKPYSSWLGYAFERLCRRNRLSIARHLEFSGISYEAGSWFQRASSAEDSGCQVDLAFLRADRMITLCEMKYVEKPQPKKWKREVDSKMDAMKNAFPGYGIESVLILGKGNIDQDKHLFDHVLHVDALLSR